MSLPYVIPEERVCNIDEPKDLLTARAMLEMRKNSASVYQKLEYKVLAISVCDDLKHVKTNLEKLGSVRYEPDL